MMKNILNKTNILAIVILGSLSLMTAVTYSFYKGADTVDNKMKMGFSTAEIIEAFDGDEKIVRVQNTGTTPLLVRVNSKLILTNGDIILDASKIANAEYNTGNEDGNDTHWIDGKDGWFYYSKLLLSGDTSERFVHITTDLNKVPDDEKSLYNNSKLDVPVNLEYYLPLKDGDIYTHEEAWNISGESDIGKILRELVEPTVLDAGE